MTAAAHRSTVVAYLQAFVQVQQLLKITKGNLSSQISSSALEDEIGQLRVWAANRGTSERP
jgi:hypothetical protein